MARRPQRKKSVTTEELVEKLADISNERARRSLLKQHQRLWSPELAERLYQEVTLLVDSDLPRAERLAQAAGWLEKHTPDKLIRALCLRLIGHILYVRGNYGKALEHYDSASALYRELGQDLDIARTLSGSLQTLIFLGRYDEAFQRAQQAYEIFLHRGDTLRLARLESNIGNILYRLDRFEEALDRYQRAYAELSRLGNPQDIAACQLNLAVCYISLNDFPRALEIYQKARLHCTEHNLPMTVAQVDYNIAYLYYLRGEYATSIDLYKQSRQHCEKLGDTYHMALCDLDQSEMYVELNLAEEGSQLAQQAARNFDRLGLGYEAAKATAFLALATHQQGASTRALELFDDARERFSREKNPVWPALIDLYKALVLFQLERYPESLQLVTSAYDFFSQSYLVEKAVLCELLLARLHLHDGSLLQAKEFCENALAKLQEAEAPALRYQAHFVLGQILEAGGDREAAHEAFRQAHGGLENLRSHLRSEELKIAFLKNKLEIYESLVSLNLTEPHKQSNLEKAFSYIEEAKSRSLADLISFRAHALQSVESQNTELVSRMKTLREELHWAYRQVDLQEQKTGQENRDRIRKLRQQAHEHEAQLLQTLSDLRTTDMEFSVLQNGGAIDLETIRSNLRGKTLLLEYYTVKNDFYVCLLTRDHLEVFPLGPADQLHESFRFLQFQLNKFSLGPDYTRRFSPRLLEATQDHLRSLYDKLIAPIRHRLSADHLIIVPHSFLHYIPFHALYDGAGYLMDEYSISYAPSASVYSLCCTKKTVAQNQSLILGISDALTPYIEEEVENVASVLPNPIRFQGENASDECLRTHGPDSRFVHIATHGLFRQDNPMFSSIQLGNTRLSLFDLYDLKLSADLVTLSGCGTGLSVVIGGDELLGLVRGLFYAGAKAVVVSLWDVNDQSTAQFMKAFYQQLQGNPDKARAMQAAMKAVREKFPHPYHWAPFVLVGKHLDSIS
jgi:CHAT domain-containing protein